MTRIVEPEQWELIVRMINEILDRQIIFKCTRSLTKYTTHTYVYEDRYSVRVTEWHPYSTMNADPGPYDKSTLIVATSTKLAFSIFWRNQEQYSPSKHTKLYLLTLLWHYVKLFVKSFILPFSVPFTQLSLFPHKLIIWIRFNYLFQRF